LVIECDVRFRVKSAVLTVGESLPIYPDKQTFSESDGMSQMCQQRKSTIHIAMRRNVGFTSGPPQLLREVDMSQGQSIRDASHLYEV
jgi:hypothetical protein